MATLATAVVAAYYMTLGVLALYGLHRLVLLAGWWRHRARALPAPAPPAADEAWPLVTVQLPLYNERFVAERLLRAVARLDYPAGRLEVQVLDDSTDDTRAIASAVCAELRRAGVDIHHLCRGERTGFKAGALAAGLEVARGELVCIFDADFVPAPDFLRRLVPWFADPGLGMVQARWGHLNREDSLATRVQAMLLDGHFAIEHFARNRTGCFFNFNGTAGVWRRAAIEDADGWRADTLTEDLDLSYRAQLAGWRFLFLPDVVVPAELPAEIADFEAQQHRWAKGAAQTARKLLPRILAAPLPGYVRREAFVHLTANVCYPLMALLAALIFPAMLLRRGVGWVQLAAVDLPLFAVASGGVLLFYLASQHAVGEPWRERIRLLPALMATGVGLSVPNSAAVVSGVFTRGGVFQRTPKYRREGGGTSRARGGYGGGRRLSFWVEGALAAYFLGCVVAAVALGMWPSLPFLYLFLQGYGYQFLAALRLGADAAVPASTRPRATALVAEP